MIARSTRAYRSLVGTALLLLITPAMTPYIYIRHRRRVAASSRVGASYITPRICSDRMLLLLTSLIEVHLHATPWMPAADLTNRDRCRCTCCSRSCTRRRRATTPACSTAAAALHTRQSGWFYGRLHGHSMTELIMECGCRNQHGCGGCLAFATATAYGMRSCKVAIYLALWAFCGRVEAERWIQAGRTEMPSPHRTMDCGMKLFGHGCESGITGYMLAQILERGVRYCPSVACLLPSCDMRL